MQHEAEIAIFVVNVTAFDSRAENIAALAAAQHGGQPYALRFFVAERVRVRVRVRVAERVRVGVALRLWEGVVEGLAALEGVRLAVDGGGSWTMRTARWP